MNNRWISEQKYWDKCQGKLLKTFQRWYREGGIPDYVKTGRIVPLSKDKVNGQYPEFGKVRTITILNAVTKLYELCLLCLIQEHIEEYDIIHPYQRGFRENKSTRHNLLDIFRAIDEAKKREKEYRSNKIPNANRTKQYVLSCDLEKCFDRCQKY